MPSLHAGMTGAARRTWCSRSPATVAVLALLAASCHGGHGAGDFRRASADGAGDFRRPSADPRTLKSIAVRVHDLNAMVSFYEEAFGVRFRKVDTLGLASRFAEIDGVTLKLVPLRAGADFENYPVHQLGFEVESVETVLEIAERYGGRREGEIREQDGRRHGAVRDPDGNTIELHER